MVAATSGGTEDHELCRYGINVYSCVSFTIWQGNVREA